MNDTVRRAPPPPPPPPPPPRDPAPRPLSQQIKTADDAITQTTTDNGLYGQTHPDTIQNLHDSRDAAIERANQAKDWSGIHQIEQAYQQAEDKLDAANDQYVTRTVADDVRGQLGQLEDPSKWAQPATAQQQNLGKIATAMETLANGVKGMDDPAAKTALVDNVLGDLQGAIQQNYNSGASFENKSILEQTGRLAAIAKESGNIGLFNKLVDQASSNPALSDVMPDEFGTARMTLDDKASMEGISMYIDLAKRAQVDGASQPFVLVERIISYHNSETTRLTQEYASHTKDLNWHVANLGQNATPENLQKAVDNYLQAQSPEWRSKYESLRGELAEHGQLMLNAANELRTSVPELKAQALTETMFSSKESQFAVKLALQENPNLATTPNMVAMRDWMAAAAGGGGSGFKATPQIAQALGTTFLRQQVSSAMMEGINAGGTPDPQRLVSDLEALKSPGLARSLGLSDQALSNAIDELRTLNTEIANGDARTPEQLRALVDRLNGDLSTQEAFAADTAGGQVFRSLASTVSALSFAKATSMALDDPDFINVVNATAQGFDVAQQISQMGTGAGLISDTSALGRYANSAGVTKLLGSVGVALDVVGAVEAFGEGDALQGALQTTSALGGAVAIFGAGSAWGPAGAIVGGVAALTSLGVSAYREKQEADKYQTDTAKKFMQDVGFNEQTAGILYDTSGEGLSPLPLLTHYAAERGLTPQQTTDFLNSLGTEYGGTLLKNMRDVGHKVLDNVDGDLGRLDSGTPFNSQLQQSFNTRVEIWAAQNGVRLPPPR